MGAHQRGSACIKEGPGSCVMMVQPQVADQDALDNAERLARSVEGCVRHEREDQDEHLVRLQDTDGPISAGDMDMGV